MKRRSLADRNSKVCASDKPSGRYLCSRSRERPLSTSWSRSQRARFEAVMARRYGLALVAWMAAFMCFLLSWCGRFWALGLGFSGRKVDGAELEIDGHLRLG